MALLPQHRRSLLLHDPLRPHPNRTHRPSNPPPQSLQLGNRHVRPLANARLRLPHRLNRLPNLCSLLQRVVLPPPRRAPLDQRIRIHGVRAHGLQLHVARAVIQSQSVAFRTILRAPRHRRLPRAVIRRGFRVRERCTHFPSPARAAHLSRRRGPAAALHLFLLLPCLPLPSEPPPSAAFRQAAPGEGFTLRAVLRADAHYGADYFPLGGV